MNILLLAFIAPVLVDGVYRSSGVAPWLYLNDGYQIPSFGLGTWLGFTQSGVESIKPSESEIRLAVEWAIDAGYRHIDTASFYNNENQIGEAIHNKIAQGAVRRQDLFIASKLWNDRHKRIDVVPALRESLSRLNLDYLDLYLIHTPISLLANSSIIDIDYLETWGGMIEALGSGLTRSIGVANFNQTMVERLIASSRVKPAVLQVEINLNLQQSELLNYCRRVNIIVTGYTPFGSLFYNKAKPGSPPPRVDDKELVAIANKYNKTVPQITLRYLWELGVVPIPKSVQKSRIEENIQIFDFQLTNEDKVVLKSFDRHYRTILTPYWIASPYYPFYS